MTAFYFPICIVYLVAECKKAVDYHEGKRNVMYCPRIHKQSETVAVSLAQAFLPFCTFSLSFCSLLFVSVIFSIIDFFITHREPYPARLND